MILTNSFSILGILLFTTTFMTSTFSISARIPTFNHATGSITFWRSNNNNNTEWDKSRNSQPELMTVMMMSNSEDENQLKSLFSWLGVRDPDQDLQFVRTDQDPLITDAHSTLYSQHFQLGDELLPVSPGGSLRVHFSSFGGGLSRKITSASGSLVNSLAPQTPPDLTTPKINADEAIRVATVAFRFDTEGVDPTNLITISTNHVPRLVLHRTHLSFPQSTISHSDHVSWEVELSLQHRHAPISRIERFYIDAWTGKVVERIPLSTGLLDRHVFVLVANSSNTDSQDAQLTFNNVTQFWAEGQAFPTANEEANLVITHTQSFYQMMSNGFGFDSYDNASASMVMALAYNFTDGQLQCPNAFWSGAFAVYCGGATGQDVVAHEWMHAFTQHTANLLYLGQPGAINEAISDIFGESIQLLLSNTTMAIANRSEDGSQCSSIGFGTPAGDLSQRWLIAETSPAFDSFFANGSVGLRDMWRPQCYKQPGKLSDEEFMCDRVTRLAASIHTNSGVANHGFALVVDGGTFNGLTVRGIGIVKALHIYYRALSLYSTEITGFKEHADSLEASCDDLLQSGMNLTDPLTGLPTDLVITPDDCAQVSIAVEAVELRSDPIQCEFMTLFHNPPPPECSFLIDSNLTSLFFDDFEENPEDMSWTFSNEGVFPSWTPKNWELVSGSRINRNSTVFWAPNPQELSACLQDDNAGQVILRSPPIAIPPIEQPGFTQNLVLSFWHAVSTEFRYDGGLIQISADGDEFQFIDPSQFVFNRYNVRLAPPELSSNPQANRWAFSGSDDEHVVSEWGQTIVDLTSLISPDTSYVRIQFIFAQDGCNGVQGWWIDDVHLYMCTAFAPPIPSSSEEEESRREPQQSKTITVSSSLNSSPSSQVSDLPADSTSFVDDDDSTTDSFDAGLTSTTASFGHHNNITALIVALLVLLVW